MFSDIRRKISAAANLYSTKGWKAVTYAIRRRVAGYDGYLDSMPDSFFKADAEGRFALLMEANAWGGSDESASGHGSTLEATREYRSELVDLIRNRGFRKLFDAPCGDLAWMSAVIAELPIEYLGGDIVRSLVERNRELHPALTFVRFDITKDAFPASDLWHCRDCLFHLSFEDIARALVNFQQSEIPYALLTSDSGPFRNKDIETGDFRYLDLLQPPFSFPEPQHWLNDRFDREMPRRVGLWDRSALKEPTERFARTIL
jgi:hypothetical protein